jgi:hypothetical protein
MRARVRSVLRSSAGLSGVRGRHGCRYSRSALQAGRKDGITIKRRRVREEAGFSDSKWKSGGKASKALLAIKKRKGADWRQGSVIGGGF